MLAVTGDERLPDRRGTHGVSRSEVSPGEGDAGQVHSRDQGDRALITASGSVVGAAARDLARALSGLDPLEHLAVTVDLRGATSLDPLAIHAFLEAWERRGRAFGCIRVLTEAGPVGEYLETLALHHALHVIHPAAREEEVPTPPPAVWEAARDATLAHYDALLNAVTRRDLPGLRSTARAAHPVCVAAGARPGGGAFGEWCEHCPLVQQYGGCQPLIERLLRCAGEENWEAAELLALSLRAEAGRMRIPGTQEHAPTPGAAAGAAPAADHPALPRDPPAAAAAAPTHNPVLETLPL